MVRVLFWLAAVAFIGAYVYLNVYPRFVSEPRAQPLRFSHKAHFEDATCEACHMHVMELPRAGVPTLEECLDCHDGVQSEHPEDQEEEMKLELFVEEEREIPWALLPPLAPHVYFSHQRHALNAEIECATCHGDIAETATIPGQPPYEFRMTWCIDCHQEREATTDCLACHR